ncbi:aspartyl-phosphate phosphatase Spo0E family protein [Sutcliffiella cohnii]|uniref:aspartyl-phosphate phosphatase Spo0E family protein n=1 Tax=Sutcliffiella cohnii TaxID=33932 RepID=UPI00082D1256|nr:aspartyl-phosphate phosphatase Spo0E family protein [Sutcliffiella cohnii]
MYINKLKEEIEKKKLELIKTANASGMTSKKTLNCSRELDLLIIRFQRYSLLKYRSLDNI